MKNLQNKKYAYGGEDYEGNELEIIDRQCKELDRLCREICKNEEARNCTVEDIINSRYWENETKKEIFFGKNNDVFDYWLSSRCVYPCSSSDCYFGLQYVYSSGVSNYGLFYYGSGSASSDNSSYGVRPVIKIKY